MNSRALAEVPPAWRNSFGVRHGTVDAEEAEHNERGLTDDLLLRICRLRQNDPQVTSEWIAMLRVVTRLVLKARDCQDLRLEAAVTLLASTLGQLTHFNPTHRPFGYNGPRVRSRDWIEREALERIGTQLVGLTWCHASAEGVADAVQWAVSDSIRLGFLEQREYDTWRPGMPSGSGWRFAVTATPYGVTRALLLGSPPTARRAVRTLPEAAETEADAPDVMTDSGKVTEDGANAPDPSHDDGDTGEKQYRNRLLALCEARGLVTADPTERKDRDVRQTAARLADELTVWVEAISDAEADSHTAGGYWTALGEDLEEMLGPAQLAAGTFEDDWTPLLTQLQMTGLSELADTLDRLAKEVIPEAWTLARDMDAVAYLRNGGPRDTFYDLYAKDELVTHEACVLQGRRDVSRKVMRLVGMLRTLADGTVGATPAAAKSSRRSKPQPRRGTRTASIEKLEKELEKHLLAARDHAHSLIGRGADPELLPRPTQKELARRTGLTGSDVSRCLKDKHAKVLRILWEAAGSLDGVMRFKRRR
jgi:hypothetical protein